MLLIFYFLQLLWIVSCHPHEEDVIVNLDHETHLYYHVLDEHHYIKHLRPTANQNESMDVTAEMHLNAISSVPNLEELTVSINIKMYWHDARLKWNTTEYGNVPAIVVPSDLIWKPSIGAMSEHTVVQQMHSSPATVQHTGSISWQATVLVMASCKLDATYFPDVEKTCEATVPFGHHHAQKEELVTFHFLNTEKHEVPYSDKFRSLLTSTWSLVDSSLSLVQQDEHDDSMTSSHHKSDDVKISLQLTRRYELQSLIVTGPAVAIACLLPAIFLIPSDSSSKVTLAAIILIGLCMSMKTVLDLLPKTCHGYPRIVIFYVLCMGLTSASIIFSICVATIAAMPSRKQMPMWLRRIFFGSCGLQRWLCVNAPSGGIHTSTQPPFVMGAVESDTDHDASFKDNDGDNLKDNSRMPVGHQPADISRLRNHEWQEAARLMDRLLLIMFVFIVLFACISLLS